MSRGPSSRAPSLWTPTLVRVTVTLLLGAGVANLFVIAPRFLGEAGYDKRDIGVVMGGFNLASLVAATAIAGLCRRFGYPRVIAAGCALAAGGAAVFAAADSMAGFTAARAIHGAGMAAIMIGATAYVAETAPAERLGQALGVAGVLTLVAMALGPALAQLLPDVGGWAWVWQAGIVSGLAAAALALTLPPIGDHAVGPSPAAARPWPALVTTTLAGVGFGAIWSFLADYGPRAGAPVVTGFFTAYVAAAVTARLALGGLSDRVGRAAVVVPALLGHAVALLAMSRLGATWHLVAIGVLYGLCHGVYYPALQALVVERAGGHRGAAIAASTFGFGLGLVVASFGLGALARAAGYPAIYLVAAAAGLAAAGVLAASERR